ncbi:serine protease [Skermanella stibiiresistens SB22]|uniref:Serine protease n=1 Tax=Skermanella stibiiresistens SB22 TaxID=1385369 RepID=W9GW88_9PROT|nr:serine protease [Skermanella stibiiresistens SB22]
MPNITPFAPELIVVAKPGAGLRARTTGLVSMASADLGDMVAALSEAEATMRPLFGENEERIRLSQAALPAGNGLTGDVPDLSLFYHVEVPGEAPSEALTNLADKLRGMPVVAAAYVKPPTYLAAEAALMQPEPPLAESINDMTAAPAEAPPASPDFTASQLYLDAAPGGIDARYAWTLPGGRGAGVRVIDIEGAWLFTHEDLRVGQGGIIGTATNDLGWRNHGTAVAGVISGDVNTLGITGICPDAHIRGASIFGPGSAGAIRAAADLLSPGDIILIELHRPGPQSTGVGQQGFIAIEWWPDDYAAIRYAVNRGIIVVEAAGNGAVNLDDPIYNTPGAGFPADWRNPFNRAQRDSGAVLVGAGAPPPGTHGRDHGPDRSRLDFSNFGAAVDAQGWGREVTTAGYGNLQGGSSEELWYTDTFSGTSSASPIVVGAIGCTQGVLRARGRIPLSPARTREILRATGSPQTDAPTRPRTQRIGNRPNLRQVISMALQQNNWIGVQFTGTLAANTTQRWFTYNWPAHWHVVWTIVPVSPRPGGAQIRWQVEVERASDRYVTYWISITNLTNEPVNVEARYAVLGW